MAEFEAGRHCVEGEWRIREAVDLGAKAPDGGSIHGRKPTADMRLPNPRLEWVACHCSRTGSLAANQFQQRSPRAYSRVKTSMVVYVLLFVLKTVLLRIAGARNRETWPRPKQANARQRSALPQER